MKKYVIKHTSSDGHVSYYQKHKKHGINTEFFKDLGFNVPDSMTYYSRLEDAKRFNSIKEAKEEMKKAGINYYKDNTMTIEEIEEGE